jgi:hypothetical protein
MLLSRTTVGHLSISVNGFKSDFLNASCEIHLLAGLPIFCYRRKAGQWVHVKSQVLEIHTCEKDFKVSHNKGSHKVEVLQGFILV